MVKEVVDFHLRNGGMSCFDKIKFFTVNYSVKM